MTFVQSFFYFSFHSHPPFFLLNISLYSKIKIKVGNGKLPKDRTFIRNGNITITNLRKEEFGKYECILKNEIATLVASTALRINGLYCYALCCLLYFVFLLFLVGHRKKASFFYPVVTTHNRYWESEHKKPHN